MRLLNVAAFDAQEDQSLRARVYEGDIDANYAILSHRWRDDEVLFDDVRSNTARSRHGYAKLCSTISQAQRDGFGLLWVDTCCINKDSSAELSEAINSMFAWYERAARCYVYLDDVMHEDDLAQSSWFKRGWTLQELLAPRTIHFFNREWQLIGDKNSLALRIAEITKIPLDILYGDSLDGTSVAARMSWASSRKTTRVEDMAYSLLGIFKINMPLIYGEGSRAFLRLQEEIMKISDDYSLFAWKHRSPRWDDYRGHGLLADSPDDFWDASDIVAYGEWRKVSPFETTNRGLKVELGVTEEGRAVLPCHQGYDRRFLTIRIANGSTSQDQYTRILDDPAFARSWEPGTPRVMYFRQTQYAEQASVWIPFRFNRPRGSLRCHGIVSRAGKPDMRTAESYASGASRDCLLDTFYAQKFYPGVDYIILCSWTRDDNAVLYFLLLLGCNDEGRLSFEVSRCNEEDRKQFRDGGSYHSLIRSFNGGWPGAPRRRLLGTIGETRSISGVAAGRRIWGTRALFDLAVTVWNIEPDKQNAPSLDISVEAIQPDNDDVQKAARPKVSKPVGNSD